MNRRSMYTIVASSRTLLARFLGSSPDSRYTPLYQKVQVVAAFSNDPTCEHSNSHELVVD